MQRYRVTRGDHCAYFCTLRIEYWLPIFNSGEACARLVLESLDFCRRRKGLILYAYVLMLDHLHLIAQHADLAGLVRDFKSWTSKALSEQLRRDGRSRWLELFENAARIHGRGQELKVWADGYHPEALSSDAMFLQKFDYVHENPVVKGFVDRAEQWRWSSARNYLEPKWPAALEVDLVPPLIV